MATCARKEEELNCPICFHQYVEPRRLSGCSHSFCESCIVNIIVSLKEEGKLGSEFECPVCKLLSHSPGIDDNIHRWVTSLEANEEIKNKCLAELKNVAGTGLLPDEAKCCSHCLAQEKVVAAGKYCLSCMESYCDTCSGFLHAFKVNKHHVVVDTVNRQGSVGCHDQALLMLKGFITCSDHPDHSVMFYCENDKVFFVAVSVLLINIKHVDS